MLSIVVHKYQMGLALASVLCLLASCAAGNKELQSENSNRSVPNSEKPTTEKKAKNVEPESGDDDSDVTEICSRGGEKRTLKIVKKEDGCVLKYSKSSKTRDAAHSSNGLEYCNGAKSKIRKNLEKAGFECS